MRAAVLAIAFQVACGSSAPAVAPPPSHEVARVALVVAPPAMRRMLPSAVVTTFAGVPLYIDTVGGLNLFSDEELVAQTAIAEWASAQGLTVLPPAVTLPQLERALRGQDPRTGVDCGAGLRLPDAVDRWHAVIGTTSTIDAGVSCRYVSSDRTGCILDIAIRTGDDDPIGRVAASYDPTRPWHDELVHRLPTTVDTSTNDVEIATIDHTPGDNPFIDDPKADNVDAAELATATACLRSPGATLSDVLVEYGRDGTVARCAPAPAARADTVDCVCRAVAAHHGAAGARQRFSFVPIHTRAVTRRGLAIVAYADDGHSVPPAVVSDPGITLWDGPRDELAPCFVDSIAPPGVLTATISATFDATGHATAVVVTPIPARAMTVAETRCVRAVFMTVQVPCPTTPVPSLQTSMHVELLPRTP